ncbi:MAG: ribbon-helix-helix domain-containing protein [Pseudomonadaceae bacterium]|nr:ribbon-helix-helix domain-containing protein [Pseudomonadaceae bacterium]
MIFPVETRVITTHVPVQLAERVDQLAARIGRSTDWIVKQALVAWIDQEEERGRLTCAALADVDAGRVIDHQTVQAWADSLSTVAGTSVKVVGANNGCTPTTP